MNDLIIVIKKIVCRYVSLVGIFILLLVAGCYSGVNKTVSNNKFAIEKHRKLYFPKTTVKLNERCVYLYESARLINIYSLFR